MDERKKRAKVSALRYREGEDRAPRLVAKGQGQVAEKILEIARRHGIPIREDAGLVEVLSVLDLREEIPPELYKAVAEILAFIFLLNRGAATSAGRSSPGTSNS